MMAMAMGIGLAGRAAPVEDTGFLPEVALSAAALPATAHPLVAQITRYLENQGPVAGDGFQATNLTKADYLRLVKGYTRFMLPYQQPDGGFKDPNGGGSGYGTPGYAACAATLVATGYDTDPKLLESAVKAVDWSLTELYASMAKMRACDAKGMKRPGGVTDFFMFPLMLAYEQLEKQVPAELYAAWTEKLKGFDPVGYILYRTDGNNWPIVHGGGEFLRSSHGFTDLKYVEWILAKQKIRMTPFGMFMEGGAPFAYDGFSRYYLTMMLHRGYRGEQHDFYRNACWKGAWTALLCQSPFGEMPAGYRSSHHSWNEGEQAVIYELYAAHYARAGRLAEAGAFKRGARLSLQCLTRWVRPEGGPYVTKNRFPLKGNFKVANPYSTYSLLTGSMLCWAYLVADDNIAERPAPADVGGFAFHIPEFNMALANAGGTYVQYMTRGNHLHNPTGLLRVHLRGGNPQLGPSDGAVEHLKNSPKEPQQSVSVGPAWVGADGKEIRLAEFPVLKRHTPTELHPADPPQAKIEVLSQTPGEAVFLATVDWQDKGRVTEKYTLNRSGLTVTDEIVSPAVKEMRLYFPLLVTDGLEETKIDISGNQVTLGLRGAGVRLAVLEPAVNSWQRSKTRIDQFNGLIEPVFAEITGSKATYRISVPVAAATPPATHSEPGAFTPAAVRAVLEKVAGRKAGLPPLPVSAKTGSAMDRGLRLAEQIRVIEATQDKGKRTGLIAQYYELARSVRKGMGDDGLWRVSPKETAVTAPDLMLTALNVHALAWGINQPVRMMWLDSCRVSAIRGWLALARQVEADGRFRAEAGSQERADLAAQAFLLAGHEVLRLATDMQQPMPFVQTEEYQRDVKEQQARLAAQPEPTAATSRETMRRTCAWQQTNLFTGKAGDAQDPDTCWFRGTLFVGVMDAYRATQDGYYLELALKLAEKNQWKPGPNARHDGNDFAITQSYLELYKLDPRPERLAPSRAVMDQIIATDKRSLVWGWCDALFMAPAAFAQMSALTGDPKYLQWMHQQWWKTTETLFDQEDHLFVRDQTYLTKPDGFRILERNGQEIFWGRGNGWVIGGLCHVLQALPPGDPQRGRYEQLLRDMADALAKAQGADGLWRASLHDPESYPLGETSGSTFYCYGLAWGINHGVLDKARYQPLVKKAWRALLACVETDGKLGYVQQPADSPRSPAYRRCNVEYATGALLMAGGEMLKLLD